MKCSICKKECLESELKDGICGECLEKEKKMRMSINNNKVFDKVMFGVESKKFQNYNSIAKHWIGMTRLLIAFLIILCIIFLFTIEFPISIIWILISIASYYIIWLIMRSVGEIIQLLEDIKKIMINK